MSRRRVPATPHNYDLGAMFPQQPQLDIPGITSQRPNRLSNRSFVRLRRGKDVGRCLTLRWLSRGLRLIAEPNASPIDVQLVSGHDLTLQGLYLFDPA